VSTSATGVTLSYKDNSFWILDDGDDYVYHFSEEPENPKTYFANLMQGDVWDITWQPYASGVVDSSWFLDVLFESSYGNINVPDTDTADVTVNIIGDTIAPDVAFKDVLNPPGNTPLDGSSQFDDFIPIDVEATDVGNWGSDISAFIDFDNSLKGWWRMDEIDGSGNPLDYSDYNNHGTRANGAVQAEEGALGKGFEFDGIDDYVDCGGSSSLNIIGDLTISTWVYMKDAMSYPFILGKPNGANDWGYLFQFDADSRRVNLYLEDANQEWTTEADTAVTLNQWTHLAVTYDGTTIQYYFNGAPDGTKSAAVGGSIKSNTASVLIGKRSDGFPFKGTIDDVMIFDRVLSVNEIAELYADSPTKSLSESFSDLDFGGHTFNAYAQDTYGNVILSIAVSNPAVNSIPTCGLGASPTACDDINVSYIVEDLDGEGTIDDATASLTVQGPGGAVRSGPFTVTGGTDCIQVACATCDGNQANYSCAVEMEYFYDPGSWSILVSIDDADTQTATCSVGASVACPSNFNYASSVGLSLKANPDDADASVTFSVNVGGATNQEADTNPTVMHNRGNTVLGTGGTGSDTIDITGANLDGNTLAQNIPATTFSTGGTSSATSCGDDADSKALATTKILDIPGLDVPFGPLGSDQDNLHFCLFSDLSGETLTDGTGYSGTWDITLNGFILVLIKFIRFSFGISLLLVTVSLKKKSLRKRLKKRIRKKRLLSYNELFDLDLILKKKYNISIKELLKESKKKVKEKADERLIEIPISIFSSKLSPAEALCKYLKENKGLKFSEIGRLINRDERGIWNSYKKGIKKIKTKIKIGKVDEIMISIKIFANRRLSILESVVKYLKEEGYRNNEIARLLDKDERNISTLYLRAKKKLS
jgi:hypothetical protein